MHANFVNQEFVNKGQLLSGKFSHFRKQPGVMFVLRVKKFNNWLLCVSAVLQEPALRSAWQHQLFDSGRHAS